MVSVEMCTYSDAVEKKVLIVEDEPLIRIMAKDIVEDAGFSVLDVGNADDALVLMNSYHNIRVIFTDVDMPGSIDGIEFATIVKERWPHVGIIIASGHRYLRDQTDMPAGSIFLSKPYDVQRLNDTLCAMVA